MDAEIIWSPEARDDLLDIAEYISRDSAAYASALVSEILRTARIIGRYPEMGRIVPEMDNALIRERIVYSYRVIYKLVDDNKLLVVAVIHCRR